MYKIGLKLWSINKNYGRSILKLFIENICQYIELYIIPGSYEEFISFWKDIKIKNNLDIPFIIHAPHFSHGMNLARAEKWEINSRLAAEAFLYADDLMSGSVIFHPGVEGNIEETAGQLKRLADNRIVIENKPYYSNDGRFVCNGHSPEDIRFLMNKTGLNFCLDIGHCVCAANARKVDIFNLIGEFLDLKPAMYHLTDGDINGIYDRHDRYGKGNFPIKDMLGMIPPGSLITNESVKTSQNDLDDVKEDVLFLKKIINLLIPAV